MAIIMTHQRGALALWDTRKSRSFDFRGQFRTPKRCAFARMGGFNANGNHAPSGCEGAVTSDSGLELLQRTAGL